MQKQRSEKVIRHLIKSRPADFERLTTKYDPTGEYKKKLEKVDKELAKEYAKATAKN